MKKLLLGTAAIALGMAFITSPANAQVKLDVGGHFKGYVTWVDQDEQGNIDADIANEDARSFDILRETEVHFSGETTLDNGLTVGAHIEAEADGSDTSGANRDSFDVEESYVYFSGAWGRVNFGAEDGAAYLLQVSAPSADSNVDGIRQYVQPVNYGLHGDGTISLGVAGDNEGILGGAAGAVGAAGLGSITGAEVLTFDYDQAISDRDNKLTYMTPVFNGFQAAVSYTPEMSDGVGDGANSLGGVSTDDTIGDYGDIWDMAARYEGQFDQVGVSFGGGWTHAELENSAVVPVASPGDLDDREAWNVGLDLDWKAFGLGVAYTEDDMGLDGNSDRETWVVGLDYTTGPFKLGASYYNQDFELGGISGAAAGGGAAGVAAAARAGEVETERWTGGVVYTYGPGMTFRGSVSFIDHDLPGATATGVGAGEPDFDATSVLLGTQINF